MVEEKVKKPWYKRWWAITLFVILGLIILGNIFGSKDNTPSSSSAVQTNAQGQAPQDAQEAQKESKLPEVKTYSLGDEIQAGDFNWKVTRFSTTKEIGKDVMGNFFGKKADGIFLILDVEIENTGSSAKYLMNSFVKLVDAQNREFSPDTEAAFYIEPIGSALLFEQINPGIKKKGKIVYDVPEGLKFLNVKISSNLVESSFSNVKLMI